MEAIADARSSAVLLTVDQAAVYLGLARSTLNKWRCQGEGPSFVKLGRAVRYRTIDLEDFLERRISNSTSDY
jgi:excisionase family DNA binding protein